MSENNYVATKLGLLREHYEDSDERMYHLKGIFNLFK